MICIIPTYVKNMLSQAKQKAGKEGHVTNEEISLSEAVPDKEEIPNPELD